MKVSSEMIYLGYEDGKTQNGKDYCRVGLLRGCREISVSL